ncbi:MarR family transcriptional regulator [Corticibacter populi]|uniref:MarR family transcriptional regulator n=1 Tax=Corticibacter populi TaxID=1550736 RepID=A0A3M6QPC5_9BURK|nr:MarR family transcriptional regulator [Corticibacter populi]RMX04908.1 MarR family transcriptional regulator [Corticibacter populi]RZS33668.1 MarR family protein [Corticibacter populi]
MSLASALFSDSQARTLEWLFGQPDRAFHLNELRRLSGLGSASIQRELKRLVEAGLVRTERVGNLRRFQAAPDSPIYEELVALTRKTLGMAVRLHDALEPLESNLNLALIYGSVAKQTDTAHSDIDVLLVGEALTLSQVLERLLPVEQALGRRINPNLFTPREFAQRLQQPDSFVRRMLSQPTVVLYGSLPETP